MLPRFSPLDPPGLNSAKRKCSPISSLEALLKWDSSVINPDVIGHELNERRRCKKDSPKLLVCHDMAGGYNEDSYVEGIDDVDGFRMVHWAYMDTFVYFSHCLVTIPPVGWINASHANGVPILGTFITEWEQGAEICDKVFESEESCIEVANRLVDIAKFYRFEGWLINIENPIKKHQIQNIILFLRHLTRQCRAMLGDSSMVMWYDSVTTDGYLRWQNELNDLNFPFFDACDAIFLNYGWNAGNLSDTAKRAGPDRIADVYTGVDVFGRGVFGGGGFNSNKAMKVIQENKLSIALFAPGWVKERLKDYPHFVQAQLRFWDLIGTFLSCRKLSHVPFKTDFCDGYRVMGKQPLQIGQTGSEGNDNVAVGDTSSDDAGVRFHFNLSKTSLQPHYCCGRSDLPLLEPVADIAAAPEATSLADESNKLEVDSDVMITTSSAEYTGPMLNSPKGLSVKISQGFAEFRLFCLDIQAESIGLLTFAYNIDDKISDAGESVHLGLRLRLLSNEPSPCNLPSVSDVILCLDHSSDSVWLAKFGSLNAVYVHVDKREVIDCRHNECHFELQKNPRFRGLYGHKLISASLLVNSKLTEDAYLFVTLLSIS